MKMWAAVWMQHTYFEHSEADRPCYELTDVSLLNSQEEAESTAAEWTNDAPESVAFVAYTEDGRNWRLVHEGTLPGGVHAEGGEICPDSITAVCNLLSGMVGHATTDALHRSLKTR